MLSIALVIFLISVYAVEVLAVDNNCPTPYNGSPIENCCDLNQKSPQSTFAEIILPMNKPNVYKLKNFCDKNCSTLIFNGYCDTITDGGGWLVIQRRMDGSENFHRNWIDYEKGFGSLKGELWYGLHAIHCLTSSENWELRVDFTFSNGTKSFMHYNHFRVGPATDNYRLNMSGFTGITPNDPFIKNPEPSSGQQFSTYDRDNDKWSGSCAVNAHRSKTPGGWWYDSCFYVNVNYQYNEGSILLAGRFHALKFVEMKIRPSHCKI